MNHLWTLVSQHSAECWEVLKGLKGEVWAAWVQAIGSIAAILTAIGISRHQSNVSRSLAEEELGRRSEAVSSFATVQQINIRNEIRQIRNVIANHEANGHVLEKSGVDAALVNLTFSSSDVDAFILSNASSLPKDARLAFPQLIAMKEMYNARMRELYRDMHVSKEFDLARVNNVSHHLLGAIDRLLAEIRDAAGEINDRAVLATRGR